LELFEKIHAGPVQLEHLRQRASDLGSKLLSFGRLAARVEFDFERDPNQCALRLWCLGREFALFSFINAFEIGLKSSKDVHVNIPIEVGRRLVEMVREVNKAGWISTSYSFYKPYRLPGYSSAWKSSLSHYDPNDQSGRGMRLSDHRPDSVHFSAFTQSLDTLMPSLHAFLSQKTNTSPRE
jgi:hypothetical protein